MPIEIRDEDGDVVVVVIQGRVTIADQRALLAAVRERMQRGRRSLKLLIQLESFLGWTSGEAWGDPALQLDSGDDAAIVKAAVAGDPRWRDEIFAFTGHPFRSVPIEFFESVESARRWLES